MPRPKDSERTKPLGKDAAKLERIHSRFDYAVDQWADIRREAQVDMRHVKGDPWEPKDKKARIAAGRPVIALDEMGQYQNQVVNEVRANPRAIKFNPNGNGADDKTAKVYGDACREMEYRSHAQQHYTRAFQNMVERSYGYLRLKTEYVTDRPAKPSDRWSAFNKRLVIDGAPDPDSIYPDPDFLDATGRDWQWLFEIESTTVGEFKRRHPNAAIQNFSPELVKASNGWISGGKGDERTIRLANYWELEKHPKILCAYELTDPESGEPVVYEWFPDDDAELIDEAKALGANPTKIDEREVDNPVVTQYRTNGVEVLKQTEWVGKWIPYVGMFGKMLWVDEGSGPKLSIMSMTRLARDPNMLHAYYASCEAENIGRTPKTPWWVWKGSVDVKNAKKIQRSNHEPVAFIEIDTVMVDGKATPSLPQQILFDPQTQAIEIGKEGARRSIQAAMGLSPLPTSAQRRNEKSGVALKQIEESGQRGSYHFIDSYDMAIERMGELFEDAFGKVNDTAGEIPVLDPQKKPKNVFVNAGLLPEDQRAALEHPEEAVDSLDVTHAVTIDVGPAFASERQEASNFVDLFVGSPMMQALPPPMALEILALLVKLKNLGPIGEEIADILSPADQGEAQTVPIQKLEELKAAGQEVIDGLTKQLAQYEQEKQAKIVETEGKARIAEQADATKLEIANLTAEQRQSAADLAAATDIRIATMEGQLKLLIAKITADEKEKDRAHAEHVEGARLEQSTAMAERGRADAGEHAREERRLKRDQGNQQAKLKAAAAKAPKGGKK